MQLEFVITQIPANRKSPVADPWLRNKLAQRITQEVRKELDIQRRMYQRVTETWEEHHPAFLEEIEDNGETVTGYIGVDTTTEDGQIFNYLNKGTSIRHAVMDNPYIPKTKIRTIGSGKGMGHMRAYSKKRITRPGIEAREWSDEIYQRRKVYFTRYFENTLNTWVNHYFRYRFGR